MALTTTVGGVWVLQALLGVDTMPAALRLKPFVPSVHESLIVETTAGPLPLPRLRSISAWSRGRDRRRRARR